LRKSVQPPRKITEVSFAGRGRVAPAVLPFANIFRFLISYTAILRDAFPEDQRFSISLLRSIKLHHFSLCLFPRRRLCLPFLPILCRTRKSPGPMTAAVNVNAQPPGPKYSMAGAPWRKERTTEDKSPGPGPWR